MTTRSKSTLPAAPAHLSAAMRDLWVQLNASYDFSPEHLATLKLACEQADLCESCRLKIAADGLLVGARRHPLFTVMSKSVELTLRAFKDLGLEVKP